MNDEHASGKSAAGATMDDVDPDKLRKAAIEAMQEAMRSGNSHIKAPALEALLKAVPGGDAGKAPEALPIDWSTEGSPLAANGLQILHRPTEFALLFTDMTPFPGRGSPDGKPGGERAVIVSSLRIQPDSFFQMLCVMASNWNRYAKTMIDPRMRQPRFKLLDAGDLQLEGVSERSTE